MGGPGSGWQGPKKTIVEDCLILSVSALLRQGILLPGSSTRGTMVWHRGPGVPDDERVVSIGYETDLTHPQASWLRLRYYVDGEAMDCRIRLATTRPPYGGLRWWFVCPIARCDGEPAPRVAKLYLPPGGRQFGSRTAHGLTYRSCQQSGRFCGLFRNLAAQLDVDAATIRTVLKSRSPP